MKKLCCEELVSHVKEGEVTIRYIGKFREIGILIVDGGNSILTIKYCPWCGTQLPHSLRDAWFNIVYDELGADDLDDPKIPESMQSESWWIDKNL